MRFLNVETKRFDECQAKDTNREKERKKNRKVYEREREEKLNGRPERIEEQKTRYIDYFIYCPIKRIA